MNGSEVKFTLNQVQRYEVCKALLEGRLTNAELAERSDVLVLLTRWLYARGLRRYSAFGG